MRSVVSARLQWPSSAVSWSRTGFRSPNFEHLTPTVEDPFPELTRTERDVLRLLAEGLQNTQIAERLVLAPKTVRNSVSSILTKLNVADRTGARPPSSAGRRVRPASTMSWLGETEQPGWQRRWTALLDLTKVDDQYRRSICHRRLRPPPPDGHPTVHRKRTTTGPHHRSESRSLGILGV
ncbi:MAG TPA: LuxR C-terminal-related transcriptional regulator [Microlunatus sp.]